MPYNKPHFPACLEDTLNHFSISGAAAGTGQAGDDKSSKHGGSAPLSPSRALRINRIYFLALAISVAFLLLGLLFIIYSGHLSQKDTIGYVQTATQQTKFAIEEHISEEFATLQAAAMLAEDTDLLTEGATVDILTKGLNPYNAYVTIGFVNSEKQAVWLDRFGRKHHVERLDEDFINRALTDKEIISRTQWDEVNGMYVNFYAVPVHYHASNKVKGVLFAADPEDELREIINNSLYAGQGLAHIIDRNGQYIVRSESPLVPGTGDNIFDITEPPSLSLRERVLSDLQAGRSGYLERSIYGENRLVAYAPLNINDWYVFYAVPENLVSAGLKNVITGAVAIIIIATILFVSLILLIRQVNNRARQALEDLAFIDPVTGGRNYNKFMLDAAAVLRQDDKTNYAVCYADIANFRYINDLLGREAGDRLLRYWSNFLLNSTQEGEVVGRLSADIFVSLRKYHNKEDIEKRFLSMTHWLAVYPETLSRGYKVEAYVGVYLTGESNEKLSMNDMLDRAITAQKAVKTAGGIQRQGFYSRELREQKLWETEVESRMDAALKNNEFQIYLQPKIDIQHNDRILGAEALVRWAMPDKGLLTPNRFIGIFERNGFIIRMDRFIFEASCRYYRENILEGSLPPCIISVNVSKLNLMQPDFIWTYTRIKEQYDIPDGCLELEFTESLVFENPALLQPIVTDCKRHGFLCSLDDFGAGYSSLNLLKSIYVDVLKLDRLFFQYGDNPERGRELIRNIVAMAKALGMKIVAEGVDVPDEVNRLRAIGCDAIQGYVFAKPMSTEDFGRFFDSWPGKGL